MPPQQGLEDERKPTESPDVTVNSWMALSSYFIDNNLLYTVIESWVFFSTSRPIIKSKHVVTLPQEHASERWNVVRL